MTHHHSASPPQLFSLWGTVTDIAPGQISIAGISRFAGMGNEIKIEKDGETVQGEILSVSGDKAIALLFSTGDSIRIGDTVQVDQTATVTVGDHWLGNIVNYQGKILDGAKRSVTLNTCERSLKNVPPPPHLRRQLGPRLSTGMMTTDTLLPICRGQRIGLFAGSGVGKSTLLGALASGLEADRVVIALIGERDLSLLLRRQVIRRARKSVPHIAQLPPQNISVTRATTFS
jgi:flagellum-specific ATP synthase